MILKQHIAMMQYGNIQAGIASWWGQGSQTDSKISGLLTAATGTNFRWALYYENESQGDPSVSQIQNDLTYILNHYAQNPGYLRVNGKFVVFVYADANDACGMADRWKQADTMGAYIVLKVFQGYTQCASQPDSWHQYAPATAADQQGKYSYSISPGFWLKGTPVRLARDLHPLGTERKGYGCFGRSLAADHNLQRVGGRHRCGTRHSVGKRFRERAIPGRIAHERQMTSKNRDPINRRRIFRTQTTGPTRTENPGPRKWIASDLDPTDLNGFLV